MTQLHLKAWNGRFHLREAIRHIRRVIRGRITSGECLLVYEAGVKGLRPESREKIMRGWPSSKVQFSVLPHTEDYLARLKKL